MAASSSSDDADPAPHGYHKGSLQILKDRGILIGLAEVYEDERCRAKAKLASTSEEIVCESKWPPLSKKCSALTRACAGLLAQLLRRLDSQLEFRRAWDDRYVPSQPNPPPDRVVWTRSIPSWWSGTAVPNLRREPVPAEWIYLKKYPQDESREVEFKDYAWDSKMFRDTISKNTCAFLNSQGGSLFFGIRDDATIVGVEPPDDPQAIDHLIQNLDNDLGRRICPAPVDADGKLLYSVFQHSVFQNPLPLPAFEDLATANAAKHKPPFAKLTAAVSPRSIVLEIRVGAGLRPVYFHTAAGGDQPPVAWKRYDRSVRSMPAIEIIERSAHTTRL